MYTYSTLSTKNTRRSLFGMPCHPTRLRANDPFVMHGAKFILFSYFPTAPLNNRAKITINFVVAAIWLHGCTRDTTTDYLPRWIGLRMRSAPMNDLGPPSRECCGHGQCSSFTTISTFQLELIEITLWKPNAVNTNTCWWFTNIKRTYFLCVFLLRTILTLFFSRSPVRTRRLKTLR
jgi:hypothetical protein